MVKILEPIKRPSFGERFADAFQAGVSEGSNFAGQLGRNQAAAQEAQQKEMAARMKGVDIAGLKKIQKESQYLLPEEQLAYVQKAKKFLLDNPTMTKDEAFVRALAQDSENAVKAQDEKSILGTLTNLLRKATDPFAPLKKGFETAQTLKERPQAGLAALGIGAAEPFEDIGRMTDPFFAIKKGAQAAQRFLGKEPHKESPSLTEMARESVYEGLSPEQRQATDELELAGALIPIESVLSGLLKIRRLPAFEKIIGKMSKATGLSHSEVAQKAAELATQRGISLEKVAAGDPNEAEKFLKITAQVSREYPKQPAGRVQKVAEKRPVFKEPEASALRKKELEQFPQYEKEIQNYERERLDTRSRVKRVETLQKESDRRKAATSEYPKAKMQYEKLAGEVRALEDEIAKLPKNLQERPQALLKYTEEELAHAEQNLLDLNNIMRTGEVRASLKDMEQRAVKKIEEITDAIQSGQLPKITKADFNPERIAEAKRLSKMKHPIVSRMKPFDKLFQAHETYKTAYSKRLAAIDKELAALTDIKGIGEAKAKKALMEEKDLMKNLIEHIDADLKLHEHQLNLRNLAARQKAEKTFKSLKEVPTSASQMKAESIFKGNKEQLRKMNQLIDMHIHNPSAQSAEEVARIAQETGAKSVTPEMVKKGTETSKKAATSFVDNFIKAPSAKNFFKEWRGFVKRMQVSPQKALFNTPIGRSIMLNAALYAIEEATGKRVPLSGDLTAIAIQPGINRFVAIGFRALKNAVNLAKDTVHEMQYKEAVKSGNLNRIRDANKNLRPKQKKKISKEMFESRT